MDWGKPWCAKTFVNGRALAARACEVRRRARLARLGAWVDSEFPRNFSSAQAYRVQGSSARQGRPQTGGPPVVLEAARGCRPCAANPCGLGLDSHGCWRWHFMNRRNLLESSFCAGQVEEKRLAANT